MGRRARLWLILGIVAAVAVVLLGFRFRVMLAGGKAILVLAILAVLTFLALAPRGPRQG